MKKQYVLSIGFFFVFCVASAQDLTVPNTPAFSILGREPSSVMRPTSVKKLSSDLLNSFDENGKLIMDVGLEAMPYWFKSRDRLTREKYLNATPWQNFLQSLSISAATVKDTIADKNNFGIGLRFHLIKGKLTETFDQTEKQLNDIQTINSVISGAIDSETISEAVETITENLRAIHMDEIQIADFKHKAMVLARKSYDSPAQFCEALNDSYQADRVLLAKKLVGLENKRTGISLEMAGASRFATTGNNAFQKAGFWMNLNNYLNDNNAWTVTGRVFFNTTDTIAVNTDLGLSYIWMEKDFNISVEAMSRWFRMEIPDVNFFGQPITRIEKKITYRLAAQVSYSVAKDVSVNLSLGKSFEDPVISKAGFFSILGLNYTIFKNPEPDLPN